MSLVALQSNEAVFGVNMKSYVSDGISLVAVISSGFQGQGVYFMSCISCLKMWNCPVCVSETDTMFPKIDTEMV